MGNSQPQSKRLRVRVSPAAETTLRAGHPWVFAKSIRDQNREGKAGELAILYDRRDRFLAVGLYDPDSPIRIRVLQAGKPEELSPAWWSRRLQAALDRRRGLFDEATTGFRCIHGESDGWPGLVMDRYDRTLVLKLYTAVWLPRLKDIIALLQRELGPERIVLRLSRNIQSAARDGFALADGQVLAGTALTQPALFRETGLVFEADVQRGQKTGFFLDQRENRRRVEALARDRRVLNAFSFSGGFSLYAARGGASAVTEVDISAHALDSARHNLALNHSHPAVADCRIQQVQADAFEWMKTNARERFDLIVLDPPSLAKREAEVPAALEAYRRLAASALGHLRKGGVLVACSCSAHVSAKEFFQCVRRSAARSGKRSHELATTGHPPDHPAAFPEADYLKAIYLRV